MKYVLFLLFALCANGLLHHHTHHGSQWIKLETVQASQYPSDRMTFHIALKQNQKGLDKLQTYILDHLSNINSELYGEYLSIQEIDALTASPIQSVVKVKQWLATNDIINCVYYADAVKCHDYV